MTHPLLSRGPRGLSRSLLVALLLAPSVHAQVLAGGTPNVVATKPFGPGGIVLSDGSLLDLEPLDDGRDPFEPPEPFDPYAIPGGAGKTFGRTVAGHFTEDDVLDVAMLANGEVMFFSGRGLYLSHDTPWTNVIDIDVYAAGGPDGQDAVVFTDATGLHLGWWDFTTKEFARLLVDGGAWAGARSVRSGDFDQQSRADLAGVSSDGHELMVLSALGGSPPVFAPLPSAGFTLVEEVLSFAPLQWDGTGAQEFALLTDLALQVNDIDGDLEDQWLTALPGGWLGVLGHDYSSFDRLVWVTPELYDPDTELYHQFIYTADKDGIDPQSNVSGVGVSSLATGDWDDDGDDDMALSYQLLQQVAVVNNERSPSAPTAVSFPSGGGIELFELGTPGAPNPEHVAGIAFGDFDDDGDSDVGTAVQATAEFRICTNSIIDETGYLPNITRMRYVVTENQRYGDLLIRISRPTGRPDPVTDMEIVLWRQEDLNGESEQVPVDTWTSCVSGWPHKTAIEIPESGQYFESVYYLEMRFKRLDAQGEEIGSFPAIIGGFTLSPLTYDALTQVPDAGPELLVIPEGDLSFNPGEVGALGGAYVPHLRVPPASGLNYPKDV